MLPKEWRKKKPRQPLMVFVIAITVTNFVWFVSDEEGACASRDFGVRFPLCYKLLIVVLLCTAMDHWSRGYSSHRQFELCIVLFVIRCWSRLSQTMKLIGFNHAMQVLFCPEKNTARVHTTTILIHTPLSASPYFSSEFHISSSASVC